eukprot:EG_transcript_13620
MSSAHNPASLARKYLGHSDDELLLEVRALKERVAKAGAEADANRHQVSVLNRNLVVMHERERRLEDVVLQLSFELGGRGHAPPKPKEYALNPEDAVDYFVQSAVDGYRKDKRVYELKCEMLQKEVELGRERRLAGDLVTPFAPPGEDKVTATEGAEDDEAREARYRAKCKKLERLLQGLREAPAPVARKSQTAVRIDALQTELAEVEEALQHERQRVKDKIQKNVELKLKISDIVERAQDRDGRRKQRIRALQALLLENGIAEPAEDDPSA